MAIQFFANLEQLAAVRAKINANALELDTLKVSDAPSDGKQYARKDGAWNEVDGAVASVNGQTGTVVLDGSDMAITPAGNISSTDTESAIYELDAEKVNVADMTATFVLYPTTTASDIGGYVKAVTSPDDADYDTPAVDVATGAIT